MSWRAELRAQLLAASRLRGDESTNAEETVARVLSSAAKVFKFACSTLREADVKVSYGPAHSAHRLSVGDEFLEAALIMNGLAIKVRRATGVVDLLHVEDAFVVDGKRRPIGPAETYFSRLAVEMVRDVCDPR